MVIAVDESGAIYLASEFGLAGTPHASNCARGALQRARHPRVCASEWQLSHALWISVRCSSVAPGEACVDPTRDETG